MVLRWCLLFWLAGTAAWAQDAGEKLADCILLEEAGKFEEALVAYNKLRVALEEASDVKTRAGLGSVRMLRRLGRLDEARRLLDDIKSAGPIQPAVQAEFDREAGLLRTSSGIQDEMLTLVVSLAQSGQWRRISDLGSPALPALQRILSWKDEWRPDMAATSELYKALLRLQDPRIADVCLDIMGRTDIPTRYLLLEALVMAAERRGPAWTQILVKAWAEGDSITRYTAATSMHEFPDLPESVWRMALGDPSEKTRHAAVNSLSLVLKNNRRMDAQGMVEPLVNDPHPTVRRHLVDLVRQWNGGDFEFRAALLRRLFDDSDEEVAEASARALSMLPQPRYRALLVEGLKSPRGKVRKVCLEQLRGIVTGDLAPAILGLLADTNPYVRQQAASLLRQISAENVIRTPADEAALVAALADTNDSVQLIAASLLARAGSKDVIQPMLDCLRIDSRPLAGCVLYHVIRWDRIDLFPELLKYLQAGRSFGEPRLEGTNSQFRLSGERVTGDRGLVQWLQREKRVDELIQILAVLDSAGFDEFNAVRSAFVECVPRTRRTDVVRVIESITRPEVRRTILNVLMNWLADEPSAQALWIAELKSADPESRSLAAKAIYSSEHFSDFPALLKAVEDERLHILAEVSSAAMRHVQPEHFDMTREALERAEEPANRSALFRILVAIKTPLVETYLLDRLSQSTVERSAILEYFSRNAPSAAVELVTRELEVDKYESSVDRRSAVQMLATTGRRDVLPLILKVLRERGDRIDGPPHELYEVSSAVRSEGGFMVLDTLLQSAPELLVEASETILDGDYKLAIKADVPRVLAFVAEPRADNILISCLNHAEPSLRAAASYAVGQALIRPAKGILEKLLRDPSKEVRTAAASALTRWEALGAGSGD